MKEFNSPEPADVHPDNVGDGASLERVTYMREKMLDGFNKRCQAEAVDVTSHRDSRTGLPLVVEVAWSDHIADTRRYNLKLGHIEDEGRIRKYAYACTITSQAEGPGLFYESAYLLDIRDINGYGDFYARKVETVFSLNNNGSRQIIESRRTMQVTEEELEELVTVLYEE